MLKKPYGIQSCRWSGSTNESSRRQESLSCSSCLCVWCVGECLSYKRIRLAERAGGVRLGKRGGVNT